MKAMILAAGSGQRMRPLTDSKPKALLEVAGQSLIEHQIRALTAAGIREIVINLAHFPEQVMAALGDGSRYGVSITYSVEQGGGLESGGGIVNALPLLGSAPFIVTSCDLVTDYPYQRLLQHDLSGCLGHLVMVPNPDFHREGDFALDDAGMMQLEGEKLNYGGIALLDPTIFEGEKPVFFKLSTVFRRAMAKQQLSGECYHGPWHNIGTPEQLRTLSDHFC